MKTKKVSEKNIVMKKEKKNDKHGQDMPEIRNWKWEMIHE